MYQSKTSTMNCIKNREHLTIVGLNPNPPPICIIFCASSVAAYPGKDNQTTRQRKNNKQTPLQVFP